MKVVKIDTVEMLFNKWKFKPFPVEGDNDLVPFKSLWEIFQVNAAYEHLCSIAAMYSDNVYLIIIGG